jgi:hypothetical protein
LQPKVIITNRMTAAITLIQNVRDNGMKGQSEP